MSVCCFIALEQKRGKKVLSISKVLKFSSGIILDENLEISEAHKNQSDVLKSRNVIDKARNRYSCIS